MKQTGDGRKPNRSARGRSSAAMSLPLVPHLMRARRSASAKQAKLTPVGRHKYPPHQGCQERRWRKELSSPHHVGLCKIPGIKNAEDQGQRSWEARRWKPGGQFSSTAILTAPQSVMPTFFGGKENQSPLFRFSGLRQRTKSGLGSRGPMQSLPRGGLCETSAGALDQRRPCKQSTALEDAPPKILAYPICPHIPIPVRYQ
jgi:hypothetical protein